MLDVEAAHPSSGSQSAPQQSDRSLLEQVIPRCWRSILAQQPAHPPRRASGEPTHAPSECIRDDDEPSRNEVDVPRHRSQGDEVGPVIHRQPVPHPEADGEPQAGKEQQAQHPVFASPAVPHGMPLKASRRRCPWHQCHKRQRRGACNCREFRNQRCASKTDKPTARSFAGGLRSTKWFSR